MPPRAETGHLVINQIATGYFHERKGYFCWRSRGTDDWLTTYTVGGHGRYGHARGEFITDVGDVVLLRPGTLHDYGVEPTLNRWDVLWAHFHPRATWHAWLDWPEEAPGLMRLKLRDPSIRRRVKRRFEDMNRLAQGPLRLRETFAMNALEEALLWCDVENPRSAEHRRLDPRIRTAMEFLCGNLAQKITLGELADVASMSVSRVAHLFREQVGVTPQQFLERQRIEHASQLLEMTPMSVKEIAHQVGFENPFYFTLRFKRQTGKSPRAFREASAL